MAALLQVKQPSQLGCRHDQSLVTYVTTSSLNDLHVSLPDSLILRVTLVRL
jgi:hypothetical protein